MDDRGELARLLRVGADKARAVAAVTLDRAHTTSAWCRVEFVAPCPHDVSLTATDRRILRLAAPAFGALAAEPLYRLVDTAIVGRLGKEQLGGVAIAISILSIVIAGSNFLAYGTTQRVANRLGADDRPALPTSGSRRSGSRCSSARRPRPCWRSSPIRSSRSSVGATRSSPLPRPTSGSRRSAFRSSSWDSPHRERSGVRATTDHR